MLLKRKKLAFTTSYNPSSGTERCTPLISSRRGRPSASCPLMSNSSTIKSTATGRSYNTPLWNGKSRNVVYCAECFLRNKQYTSKSTTKLQSRISNHRSYVGDNCFDPDTDEATLAEHLHDDHNLNSVDLFNSNYSFTILELGTRNIDFAKSGLTDP